MTPRNDLMPRVLRLLAKVFPWLGKVIERTIDSLLGESWTTEDIIRKRLGSGGSGAVAASVAGEKATAGTVDGITTAAQEMALRQIQEDFQDNRRRMQAKLTQIQRQDAVVFVIMLVSGVIALGLILWGAYSWFRSGVNVGAVLAEFVGLIGGAGTAILRHLQKDLRDKLARMERLEQDQTQYLRAIQAALALSGPERDKQLSETTKWLRDGARSVSEPSSTAEGRQVSAPRPSLPRKPNRS